MIEAGGSYQFGQGFDRLLVKIRHALRFIRYHQSPLPDAVLGCNASGTVIGVALLRLNAADREHEAAGCVAPIGAKGHYARHIESGGDLSGGSELDFVA